MKKTLLLTVAAMLMSCTILSANAEDVKLKVNGEIIVTDTAPEIINDRVMVPVRAVAEALKSDVAWDQENKAVSVFDGTELCFLWIDKDGAFKTDGLSLTGTYKMDVTPLIKNDRTLVPIRAISELFGATVDWIGEERTVTVDYEVKKTEEELTGTAQQLSPYTATMSQMYDVYYDYAFGKKNVVMAEIELEGGKKMSLELYPDIAPATVENFVKLANEGTFDGKIFHRVINDFMIQGGAYDKEGHITETEAIYGEFLTNGWFNLIGHERGVISMARTQYPDTASNQFFIVHKDSPHLNGEYAAFGKVIEGIEYVDEIAGTETDEEDKPVKNQVIKSIKIIDAE